MDLPLLSLSFLIGLLGAAAVHDLRRRRIPNALVLYGVLLGLGLQAIAPPGAGLLQGGGLGAGAALWGGGAALALFLPFYALRMLGAGDVKLLAMVGVWLGPAALLQAALWTVGAGVVLALAWTLRYGQLARVGARVLAHVATAPLSRPATATGRLPYAVAVATGSAIKALRLWAAA